MHVCDYTSTCYPPKIVTKGKKFWTLNTVAKNTPTTKMDRKIYHEINVSLLALPNFKTCTPGI